MKSKNGSKELSEPLILVAGPTASGKSELGLRLAQHLDGEIINIDSQQCYRGLNIGTGKPQSTEGGIPHWLYEEVPPEGWMSAGEFARRAEAKILEVAGRKNRPILVGGTGLYIRALLEGLDPLPGRDEGLRQGLATRMREEGLSSLFKELEQVDPPSAKRIGPKDANRIIRALEIWKVSGKPPSVLLKKGRANQLRFPTHSICLLPPREALRERISRRVEKMFESGWVEEVRGLMERGLDFEKLSNKPIGYGDIARALLESIPWEEVRQKITRRTQQYAKRQITFFRGLFANPAYENQGSQFHSMFVFGNDVPLKSVI